MLSSLKVLLSWLKKLMRQNILGTAF